MLLDWWWRLLLLRRLLLLTLLPILIVVREMALPNESINFHPKLSALIRGVPIVPVVLTVPRSIPSTRVTAKL